MKFKVGDQVGYIRKKKSGSSGPFTVLEVDGDAVYLEGMYHHYFDVDLMEFDSRDLEFWDILESPLYQAMKED